MEIETETEKCVRCTKEIKDSGLCSECVWWWSKTDSDEKDHYWDCDTCFHVYSRHTVVYCSTCKHNYCEQCIEDMIQKKCIECGPEVEDYMCPSCFTYGIDNGFITEDFIGITDEAIKRLHSYRFQKGIVYENYFIKQ